MVVKLRPEGHGKAFCELAVSVRYSLSTSGSLGILEPPETGYYIRPLTVFLSRTMLIYIEKAIISRSRTFKERILSQILGCAPQLFPSVVLGRFSAAGRTMLSN